MVKSLGEDVEPDQYVECWDEWVATDDYLRHVDQKRADLLQRHEDGDWSDDAGYQALNEELASLTKLLRQRGWKVKKGGLQVLSKGGAGARRHPPPVDFESATAAAGKGGPHRQHELQQVGRAAGRDGGEAPDSTPVEERLRQMEAEEFAEEEALADEDKDAYLSRWDESHSSFAMLAQKGAARRLSLG